MKTIVTLVFVAFSYLGFAQLIDPFGYNVTHEIKLKRLKNGMYAGAIEWTTGGVDSLQKFVITGLDVKTPVLVRIISKAPDHNIDLSFHKENWDKIQSIVSTNGDKFVDKVFRTMNNAGIGVRSEVAGMPYLITVKVGLQFPSTKSFIRITHDKEEYNNHMRKMGYTGQRIENDNNSGSSEIANTNSLTYLVIALLATIILLLVVFIVVFSLKRKAGKHLALLLILLSVGQFSLAQSSVPEQVPVGESGNNSVERIWLREDTLSGIKELTGEEAGDVLRRIKLANEQFDSDYGEDSPGELTRGKQRYLLSNINNKDFEQLGKQVQRLQRQVEILSPQDKQTDTEIEVDELLVYCEDPDACQMYIDLNIVKLHEHLAYFTFLQRYYLREITDLYNKKDRNLTSCIPSKEFGWKIALRNTIVKLKTAYNDKFDELIKSIEGDYKAIITCSPEQTLVNNIQVTEIIKQLKVSRITK